MPAIDGIISLVASLETALDGQITPSSLLFLSNASSSQKLYIRESSTYLPKGGTRKEGREFEFTLSSYACSDLKGVLENESFCVVSHIDRSLAVRSIEVNVIRGYLTDSTNEPVTNQATK